MTSKYTFFNFFLWLSIGFMARQPVQAQISQSTSVQWQRTLGPANYSDLQVTQASTDGYALIYRGEVLRLSRSGINLWQSPVPASPEFASYTNTAEHIVSLADGGFAVLVRNSFKWSLVRLDANGAAMWVKSFANVERNQTSVTRSFSGLLKTADGGFIALGYAQLGRNGSLAEVYKFNSQGDKTLVKTVVNEYGNNARGSTKANQIIPTTDGSYLLVGGATEPSGEYTAWAAKINQQFDVIWKKSFNGQEFNSVIPNPFLPGSYIASGNQAATGTRTVTIGPSGLLTAGLNLLDRLVGTNSFILPGINALGYVIVDVTNKDGAPNIRIQHFALPGLPLPSLVRLIKLSSNAYKDIKGVIPSNNEGFLLIGSTTTNSGTETITETYAPWVLKVKE